MFKLSSKLKIIDLILGLWVVPGHPVLVQRERPNAIYLKHCERKLVKLMGRKGNILRTGVFCKTIVEGIIGYKHYNNKLNYL